MYLENKTCAVLLYNMHQNFNRLGLKSVEVSMKVSEDVRKKYQIAAGGSLKEEEIWAYSKDIIWLGDDISLNRLNVLRDKYIPKRTFLLYTCLPACKEITAKEIIYNDDLDKISLEKEFYEGILGSEYPTLKDWLKFEPETIRTEDAEKIIKSIVNFFEKNNC